MRILQTTGTMNIVAIILFSIIILLFTIKKVMLLKRHGNNNSVIFSRCVLSGLIILSFYFVTSYSFLILLVLLLLDALFSRFVEDFFSVQVFVTNSGVLMSVIGKMPYDNSSLEPVTIALTMINFLLLMGLLYELNERNKKKRKATMIEGVDSPEDEGENNQKIKYGKMSDEV